MLKKWHLWTGILFLILFVLSGLYMIVNFPALEENALVRMMYRANHIYLLLTALLNIIFGSLVIDTTPFQHRLLFNSASILIILSPLFLMLAFIFEPQRATFDRIFTFVGILLVLSGVVLYTGLVWYWKRKSN